MVSQLKSSVCAAVLVALVSGCAGHQIKAPGQELSTDESQYAEEAELFLPDVTLVTRSVQYFVKNHAWPQVREVVFPEDEKEKKALKPLKNDTVTLLKNPKGNLVITIVPAPGKISKDKKMNYMFPITAQRSIEVFSAPVKDGSFKARYIDEQPVFDGYFTVRADEAPGAGKSENLP